MLFSNGQVKEQHKTAAAILADKIAASSNSQQILQSALSKFAAEEAKNSSETRSDKRQKTDQLSQVPSVANAAAFVPMPQVVATTAQQQPQAILVQQSHMQSQASASQPQYNIYQAPPQQFVPQPGGVMMGMPYNMSTAASTASNGCHAADSASSATDTSVADANEPSASDCSSLLSGGPMQPPPGMQYFHPQSQ